jgi:outer membrane protein W
MRNQTAVLLFLSALTLGATGARAEGRWTLRLAPAWFDTNARFAESVPGAGAATEASVDGEVGLAASLERSLGKLWGLEAGLLATRLPTTLEVRTPGGTTLTSDDDLQVMSTFLMLNWHPRRASRFSPFLGLGASYTRFGDLTFLGSETKGDDDFGWLAQAGAEIRLGGRLRLSSSAIFLDTTYQGRRSGDPDVELDVELRGLRVGLAIALGQGD